MVSGVEPWQKHEKNTMTLYYRSMHIGIVHSPLSKTCKCAESISVGLETLGHTYEVVDCEEIELHVAGLAERCDVVFDHTDVYQGSFRNRGDVRTVLEKHGIAVVGSSAKAIYLCDDKVRMKECFSKAGIPVPQGIVIDSQILSSFALRKAQDDAQDDNSNTCHGERSRTMMSLKDIPGPYILKCRYEHMSKGMKIVEDPEEAISVAQEMSKEWQQPILVEQLIKGKELRIGVIICDLLDGYETLPIIDVQPITGQVSVILEEEKVSGRRRRVEADLSDDLASAIRSAALQAFDALELRDYVRFDLRLSNTNEFYFLEANCIPNMHPEQDFAGSAGLIGLEYEEVIERLISVTMNRAPRR